MRIEAHPCYVLHRRPYRESSLLVELFSSEHGRVTVVAKGARRQNNPRRASFQPLGRVQAGWSGRGELGTLTQIESAAPPPALPGRQLMAAFYINELLMRMLHRHEPHPELFAAYGAALAALADPANGEPALRVFEKRLLQSLGYGLVLDRDADSGAVLEDAAQYDYDLDRGPLAVAGAALRGVRVTGATLLALRRERFEAPWQLAEAKRLLRTVLSRHLGDRPLYSREIYRGYAGAGDDG